MSTPDFSSRRAAFRKLHESGCFIIPNPWDIGSARYLRHLGFPALATTSSGFAFSQGLTDDDQSVPRDLMLRHFAAIVSAVDLPVNADFRGGYAVDPEPLAENVRLCVETGVAGLSIEDSTGDRAAPLYEFELAVDRIRAARAAIDATGTGVLLVARAECFLTGHPDPLREAIRRIQAFSAAGADVLYAPGPKRREDISAIVAAAAPKPVNLLATANLGMTLAEVAALGVRRISVGSALARAAWTGFLGSARQMAGEGVFTSFQGLVTGVELNDFFRDDQLARNATEGSILDARRAGT
jgi:2-methylisocitrate lyase-like PEP mutase family enzyme